MQSKDRLRLLLCVAALCTFSTASGRAQSGSGQSSGAPPSNSVTVSSFLSPQAREYMVHLSRDHPFAGGPSAAEDIGGYRAHQDDIMNGFLAPIEKRYPVHIELKTMGGIVTQVVTPVAGVARRNRDRVLLNVHGGGFISGARMASLVESVPIAALEGIKVISIDYRMGPEYKFPAASEDVSAVYREVLKQYAPSHIGLYGCSAGGMQVAMSVAWFDAHHLPQPAAIGILCASAGDIFTDGDKVKYDFELNQPESTHIEAPQPGRERVRRDPAYLSEVSPQDPMAYPINSAELLKKFPPTLIVTSTRGLEYSSALHSEHALTDAGVATQLHVWEDLPHAFWYNSDLPESTEVYHVIANFFEKHLHRSPAARTAGSAP
jgi:acetyl esterase/lipase